MKPHTLAAAAALTLAHGAITQAHTLWINVIPEPGKHVITSIGYGDTLPGSEILTPDWGPMQLEAYDLVSPEGKSSPLGLPRLVTQERKALEGGVSAQADPDNGARKLVVPPGARKGTYQLAARTPLVRLIHYRDKQGKSRYSEAPVATLKDVAEVLDTKLELNLMKAAFVAGGWTDPAPLGHALEIVPLSDLGAARPGDVVRFKVLLDGKAWNPTEGEAYITAHNAAFGKRWAMHSTLEAGEGEFRVPTAGPWRVDAAFRGLNTDVAAYEGQGGTKGEPLPLLIESTFVFYVAP
jgi:uncharacterized GH25 family protein